MVEKKPNYSRAVACYFASVNPLLLEDATPENFKGLLYATAEGFARAAARVSEIRALINAHPEVLNPEEFADSDGRVFAPNLQDVCGIQHDIRNFLRICIALPVIEEATRRGEETEEDIVRWQKALNRGLEKLSQHLSISLSLHIERDEASRMLSLEQFPNITRLNQLVYYALMLFASEMDNAQHMVGECPWCNGVFVKRRIDQQYCSNKCKNAFYRETH